MSTARRVVLIVLAAGGLAAPAAGQSLAERLAIVKQKQAGAAATVQELSPRMKILQTLMHRPVSASFDATPAGEVFEYLGTALDLNIVVRTLDDPVGHGIDPETPITLELDRMQALAALELILEQCSVLEPCTWQLRGGFLEIGTKERLSVPAARELRAYPIEAMLHRPPRFENAPQVGIVPEYPDAVYGGYGGYGRSGYPGGYGGGLRVGQPSGNISGSVSVGPHGGGTVVRADREADAQELLELILDLVEPMAWIQNGGTWASIAYRDGALIVYAPEFIHRTLAGYPKVPPPAGAASARPGNGASSSSTGPAAPPRP